VRVSGGLSACRANHIALHSSVGTMAIAMLARHRFGRGGSGLSRARTSSRGGGALEATSVPTLTRPALTRSDWPVTEWPFGVNLRRTAAPALGPVIPGERPASLETHLLRALDVAAVWGCPSNTRSTALRFLGIHQENHFSPGSILMIDHPKRTEYK
jgi:hypothetical protein